MAPTVSFSPHFPRLDHTIASIDQVLPGTTSMTRDEFPCSGLPRLSCRQIGQFAASPLCSSLSCICSRVSFLSLGLVEAAPHYRCLQPTAPATLSD